MMSVRALKYLTVLSIPFTAYISLTYNGWLSYTTVLYAFGLVPLLELLLPQSEKNLSKVEEEVVKKDGLYDALLYLCVPVQWLTLLYFLVVVSQPLAIFDLVGKISCMGILCGAFGINVAHELGHRRTKYEQTMAKTLLLSSLYMHFFIEHNRGHHKHVSTDEDPASAKQGEMVYTFWFKSVIMSYISAWKLEFDRLRTIGKSIFSVGNEMIWYQVIQLGLLVAIYFTFGGWATVYFIAAATVGFLLLETINYIEHYGLRRKEIKEGIYEKVLPIHSWNSNHTFGRLLLFELSRHSDHHYRANRKYQTLRHFEDAPQMPTGYPGMMLLSLLPPVWFLVMHKHIEKYKTQHEMGEALA